MFDSSQRIPLSWPQCYIFNRLLYTNQHIYSHEILSLEDDLGNFVKGVHGVIRSSSYFLILRYLTETHSLVDYKIISNKKSFFSKKKKIK